MSKILVIQPHKMLRHAFVVALSFDYQVKVVESVPEPSAMKEIDLVIVDAAALRERDLLSARELRAVQGWKLPTLWIDRSEDSPAPSSEKSLRLNFHSTKTHLKTRWRIAWEKQARRADRLPNPKAELDRPRRRRQNRLNRNHHNPRPTAIRSLLNWWTSSNNSRFE